MRPTGLTAAVLRLAARPEGVRTDEVGFTVHQAGMCAARLVAYGKLHVLRVPGMRHHRYFTDPAARDQAAEAAAAAEQRSRARKPAKSRRPDPHVVHQPVVARKPRDLGRAAWGPDTPAIVPPHVKVQICPSGYRPRFETIEVAHVYCASQRGRVMG